MIHCWIEQECGCQESYDLRWPRYPVSITMCRRHWNEMHVKMWLDEWLCWGRFSDTGQERNAGAQILFWASRCSF